MNKQDYNGWTNYETWCVNQWLTNDEFHEQQIRSLLNGGQLEDYVNDIYHDMQHVSDGFGMFHDLINASLEQVNWNEIIEAVQEKQRQT